METLKEKIDLLNLSEDERRKLEEKFAPSLSFVSIEEMKAGIDVLDKKGEKITKAREVKVLTNPASKIEKNYDFVEEVHEPGIYSEDLNRLSGNGLDKYKRIIYCIQSGIPYKNEDGTYKDFLFKESLFQKEVSGITPTTEMPLEASPETTLDTPHDVAFDAALDDVLPEETKPIDVTVPEVEMTEDSLEVKDEKQPEVDDYMQAEADLDDIESKTTTFDDIKKDLEAQLAELDALRSQNEYENNNNVYRFNDIEQETYDVGRGR